MKKTDAFTLIEIIVSLSVFFIIMTIILNTGKNIFFKQQETAALISQKQTLYKIQTTLKNELKNVIISKNFPFKGTLETLSFSTISNKNNMPIVVTYQNSSTGLNKQTKPYLQNKEINQFDIADIKISFLYLTNKDILQENFEADNNIAYNNTIKAIHVKISSNDNLNGYEFYQIINMQRN